MKPLILWGGTDVDSTSYGEIPLPTTDKPDLDRDELEFDLVEEAIFTGRSVIGVCRGAQILCVANGGKLNQHNLWHRNNSHGLTTIEGVKIEDVAADHHQLMRPEGNFVVYASCPHKDPEVVWWPETRCLAIQPHPEWCEPNHPFIVWLNNLLKHLEIDHEF